VTRIHRHLTLASLLLLASASVAGCGDDDTESRIYDLTVTVAEDSIDPNTVELRVPDRAVVTVENESDALCLFHLGPFVRELRVEPNDEASITFRVIATGEEVTTMGCEDSSTPEGEVQILDATQRE
jgi:hypothetical protein